MSTATLEEVQTFVVTATTPIDETQTHQRTKCAVYTRVMGYHRPVSSFNIGKKSEFYSRQYFKTDYCNTKFIEENRA